MLTPWLTLFPKLLQNIVCTANTLCRRRILLRPNLMTNNRVAEFLTNYFFLDLISRNRKQNLRYNIIISIFARKLYRKIRKCKITM